MKKILLIVILIIGVGYADDCYDYKKKATKYEQLGMSASNLDVGANYLRMAIKNRKAALYACFYSGGDKEKIRKDIKNMEETKRNMRREAYRNRNHELNVANQTANKINIKTNNYYKSSTKKETKKSTKNKPTHRIGQQ